MHTYVHMHNLAGVCTGVYRFAGDQMQVCAQVCRQASRCIRVHVYRSFCLCACCGCAVHTPEIVWSACMCPGCCSPVRVEVTVELSIDPPLPVLVWLPLCACLVPFTCSSLCTQRAHSRLVES
eukprot:171994-Pelagomonas_calceolata.AAC.6